VSAALDELYQQLILDHAKRRVGDGVVVEGGAEHFEKNPVCGDQLTMRVAVDGDRVSAVGWEGDGCSISMASASVFSELTAGRSVDEVRASIAELRTMLRSRGTHEPDEELIGDGVAFQGVAKYVMRVKCASLAWVAAEACLLELDARA
jgi:nitrogen fixation protein NifU and related proteins